MRIKSFKMFFSLLIILFALNFQLVGQNTKTIIINSDFEKQNLVNLVEIYSIDKLIDVNTFWETKNSLSKLPSNNFSPGLADKFYWVVLKIQNKETANKSLILKVNNPLIDSIFFYQVKNDTAINLISENGDEIPFYKRQISNELPIFPIDLNSKNTKTFILMLRKRKNIKFPLELYDEKVFIQQSRKKLFFHSIYFGGIFIIFVASFFVGFFTRSKLLFSYAIYSLTIGIYIFTEVGYGFEFIYPNTIGLNSALRVPLSISTLLAFMYFTNLFLELEKYKKYISNIFKIFTALSIAVYLFSLPFLWISTSAYHSFILFTVYLINGLALLLMIFAVISVFKHNKQKARTYISAILILTIGIVVFSSAQFGILKNDISANPFMLASIGELSVFSIALFLNIRRVNNEREKLLLKTIQQEKAILTAQIKGDETASLRISNELHDNIGSRLGLLKNKLLYKNNNKDEISQEIEYVYNDVRDISHRLSSNTFKMLGCKIAVKEYLEEVNNSNKVGIKTFFYCDAEENKISEKISFQVFRIIQEAVTNCIKYAGKSDVNVKIYYIEKKLSLIIEDNGKGFDINKPKLSNGIGIQNIKNRIKTLNGDFNIDSKIGKGTIITISIPT